MDFWSIIALLLDFGTQEVMLRALFVVDIVYLIDWKAPLQVELVPVFDEKVNDDHVVVYKGVDEWVPAAGRVD